MVSADHNWQIFSAILAPCSFDNHIFLPTDICHQATAQTGIANRYLQSDNYAYTNSTQRAHWPSDFFAIGQLNCAYANRHNVHICQQTFARKHRHLGPTYVPNRHLCTQQASLLTMPCQQAIFASRTFFQQAILPSGRFLQFFAHIATSISEASNRICIRTYIYCGTCRPCFVFDRRQKCTFTITIVARGSQAAATAAAADLTTIVPFPRATHGKQFSRGFIIGEFIIFFTCGSKN